jgi:PhnB protein
MNANTLQPIPYLLFNGDCAEAMDFYAEALGGKIVTKTSLADIPGGGFTGPEAESSMCHVRLELPGGGHLYAGDVQPGTPPIDLSPVHVAINLATAEEGERTFRALAQGGVIEMDYQPSFWAEKFGMLKDKFGVSWMVNGNLREL